jgi:hypothetical protein
MKWTRPLCGSAGISQNDFKTSETIQPQEASPMKKLSVVAAILILEINRYRPAVGDQAPGS